MPWSVPDTSVEAVAKAAVWAARKYEVQDGLVQDWLKPTTMFLLDRLLGEDLPASPNGLWLGVNNMHKDKDRLWARERSRVYVEKGEVLVDFHYFAGEHLPYRTVLTGEGEGHGPQVRHLAQMPLPGRRAAWDDSGLVWDLWKLLLVPSPVRVFVTIANAEEHAAIEAHASAILACHADQQPSDFALVSFDRQGTKRPAARVA